MSGARAWNDLNGQANQRGQEIMLSAASLPIKEIALAIAERADELGLMWHLVPATVAQPGPGGVMRVTLDGDTTAIDAVTMIGRLPVGGRVFVILSPPAGVHIVGFLGYDFPQSVPGEAVGRPRMIRLTEAFARASATLADVPGFNFTTVPNATYEVRLRASSGGPTTTDAVMAWTGPTGAIMNRYVNGIQADETSNWAASVMMMGRRSITTPQGSGTFTGGAAGSSDFPGYWEDIVLRTGAAGGTVQLQFARLTAAGTATLHADTYMVVQRFR